MIWYMYSRTNVKKRFATMDPRKQILFSMIESDPKPSLSFFFCATKPVLPISDSDTFPDAQCMVYLPTFTPQKLPKCRYI